MYTGLQHLHSYTAYLTLTFLVIAVGYALYQWLIAKPGIRTKKIFPLLGLIGTHVQVLFGLILYFVSPLGFSSFSGEAMGNAASRLYILEHPVMMLIAATLITIGYSRAKRSSNGKQQGKTIAIFYGIGLIAILLRIPWGAWL